MRGKNELPSVENTNSFYCFSAMFVPTFYRLVPCSFHTSTALLLYLLTIRETPENDAHFAQLLLCTRTPRTTRLPLLCHLPGRCLLCCCRWLAASVSQPVSDPSRGIQSSKRGCAKTKVQTNLEKILSNKLLNGHIDCRLCLCTRALYL